MQKERKKLEITLPANVDAETLEAVINGTGVKLVITSNDPKLNGQPVELSGAEIIAVSNEPYPMMQQNALTNAFGRTRATKSNTRANRTSEGDIKYFIENGDITLHLPIGFLPKDLNTNTHRFFDVLFCKLNKIGAMNRVFVIPKEEYKELRGIKSESEWAKKLPILKKDIELLRGMGIDWNIENKKTGPSFGGMSFFDLLFYENKEIKVSFAPTFFGYLAKYGTAMPHNSKVSNALNDHKNPYSYYLLKILECHKYMNSGKPNEDIISTRALRSAIPIFPALEEVAAKDRHIAERIIEPFERDLNALEEAVTWEYCHKNGTPLTDEECSEVSTNYEMFDDMLIKTTWKDYPPRTTSAKKVKKGTEKHKRTSSTKKLDQ